MKLKFLLLTLVILLPMAVASAASTSSILVDMVPSNPNPHENTTITLNSYANNLDSVMITWSVDGRTVSSGIGKKSFSVTAPATGVEENVVATIALPDGTTETKITIRPSVMVMLWQANDSYVPPFYKGKAIPSIGSEIKVVAMPEIRTNTGIVSPQNMTYVWQKDYSNQADASGYGKNSFSFINDYLENSNNVSVVASTVDQQFSSEGSVDVGASDPKILFYKNDSILGTIFEQAIGSEHIIQGSEILEAAPYFISPKALQTPTLIWSWFINDSRVSLDSYMKNFMPLQVESGSHGTSKLKLEIENSDKLFQATTTKEININY